MTIRTRLTSMFGMAHPIVLAPMGGVSGGRLAASVSKAGGLGLIGAGYGEPAWLQRELMIVASAHKSSWGIGFITWSLRQETLALALSYQPTAIMLSFGDPRPWAKQIKSSGAKLICQVQDLTGARLALKAGADIIVAQGAEGGGHGCTRSTFPLVPAVVDIAGSTVVLAAGGIADGRGLAAALMLGAEGVLIGTRFYASSEALGSKKAKQRIVTATGDYTARTQVFDAIRQLAWPSGFTGRALINQFLLKWHGAEQRLLANFEETSSEFTKAQAEQNYDTAMVWAGECVDLITSVQPAKSIVESIVREAESRLELSLMQVGAT